MRNTIQRALVLEAAKRLDHPTAEQIYKATKEVHPSISIGTVYRNLGQLVEANLLQRIDLPDGARHFDKTVTPHYHICCRACGCVEDAELPWQSELVTQVESHSGFTVERHEITLYGLCPDCQKIN